MFERTGQMDRAAPDGRAAREKLLLELLASWGASEEPQAGDLFKVVTGLRNVSDLLYELQRRGREWLPPPLCDEIDATVAILGAGESLSAPSFRSRVEQILARARESLDPRIAERRTAVSQHLRGWAPLLDRDDMDRALLCLWRTEHTSGVADQLAALADLEQVQALLASTRDTIAAQIQSRIAAPGPGAAAEEASSVARRALAGDDPMMLLRARLAFDDLHTRQEREISRARVEQACSRLTSLCETARRRIGGAGVDGAAARLRARAVEDAERALQAISRGSDSAVDFEPAITAWERTLQAVSEAGPAEGDDTRAAREALVHAIVSGLERLVPRDPAARNPDQDFLARDAAAIAAALRKGVGGGQPFQQALDRGADLLRSVRRQAEGRIQEAGAQLRAVAGDLASFLEESGEQLPTARVVRARLWLEQIEGVLASGDLGGISSMTRSVREDLVDLRGLADHVRRRRANREGAERDELRSEIARLVETTPRAASRRLQALAAEVEHADARRLPRLRDAVSRVRRSVEQSIRLEGGKVLHAANRWMRTKGGRSDGSSSQRAKEVARGMEALAGALEKSDLPALRQRAIELRAALRGAAVSRIWVEMVLAVVAVAALAGIYPALQYMRGRQQTCLLKLASPPPRPARIWLVSNGRIVRDEAYGTGDDGIRLSLPPGRYEVFVNKRYTGRAVRIPGEREVTGVPLPPE